MVAAAIPYAADAGLRILRSGGNAIDAAVATSLVCSVVEQNHSGLGGAGLATIYLRDSDEVVVVDFNAVCPSSISDSTYELLEGMSDDTGYRRVRDDANNSGYKSISVPGLLAGLDLLLTEYGTKKLSELVQPALRLARDGFRVSRFVARSIDGTYDTMRRFPETLKIYAPDGVPDVDEKIVQVDLAETLKIIAREGSHTFYHGKIAARIVDAMEKHGGLVSMEDLGRYKAKVVKPSATNYRGYDISVPPVGSGGVALLEALNILENFDLAAIVHHSPEMFHLIIEALKLTWADRLAYDADPEFVDVPFDGLLSKEYAAVRSREIDLRKVMRQAEAGDPWKYSKGGRRRSPGRRSAVPSGKDSHTTHLTVADGERNMVSMTQTVWASFGSFITIPHTGIVMNNGQSRFDPDSRSANRPEPGKRVLSNMCPTMVTRDGGPFVAAGLPGGRRIVSTMLGLLVNLIDYGRGTDSVNLPRLHCEAAEPVLVESAWIDGLPIGTARLLEKQGHTLKLVPVNGHPNPGYPYISGPASAIMAVKGKPLAGTADARQPGAIRGY